MNIDLSQNINAIGYPKGFTSFLKNNFKILGNYPGSTGKRTAKIIANFLKLNEENVIFTNGSTDIFFYLPLFLQKKEAIIISPTFWEYEQACRNNNIKVHHFRTLERENFRLNTRKLSQMVEHNSNCTFYICNPNNPTSNLINPTDLLETMKKFNKTIFIIDETYLIFRSDYDKYTFTKYTNKLPNIYIATSLSKIFALPGIRSGFLVSHKTNIEKFAKKHPPYSINSLSELITEWALQTPHINLTRRYYESITRKYYLSLSKKFDLRLKIFEPKANFILAKILSNQTSDNLVARLKKYDILVRNGSEIKGLGNKYIRFAIKTPKENKLFIKFLERALT